MALGLKTLSLKAYISRQFFKRNFGRRERVFIDARKHAVKSFVDQRIKLELSRVRIQQDITIAIGF